VLVDTQFTGAFVLKCILKAFALKIVLFMYGTLIVIAGLSLHVLEKGTPNNHHVDSSTSIWTAAYTVLTIGYGDTVPSTYFGELVLIVSCFLGCFVNSLIFSLSAGHMTLSGAESEMYSELAVGRYKGKRRTEALVLLQAWWRFMLMRSRGRLHGYVIIHFYTLLRLYRKVLAAARREKDRRFDSQMNSFQISLHRQFHSLSEYLTPIEATRNLAIDIVRSQYHLKETATKIRKITRRLNLNPAESASPSSLDSEPSPHGRFFEPSRLPQPKKKAEKGLAHAKAKSKAHQRLKARLVRAEDLASPIDVQSGEAFSVRGSLDVR